MPIELRLLAVCSAALLAVERRTELVKDVHLIRHDLKTLDSEGRLVHLRGRPVCFGAWRISQFHSSNAVWGKVLRTFKLADIGEGITECEVVRWSVQPSATVQSFDTLCEVQSDKASVEITSPFDGVVKDLLVKEGDVAKVGEGLCIIEIEDDGQPEERAAPASPPPHLEQEAVKTPDFAQDKADVVRPAAPLSRRPHPLDPNVSSEVKVKFSTSSLDILATPSVRHYARQKGVDLALLAPGSGKGGRIEKIDIDRYLMAPAADTDASTTASHAGNASDIVVELGRTRYGMWKAMVKSLEIPHFGYSTSLDLTTLHNMMPTINANIPARYLPPSSHKSHPPAVSPNAFYQQPPQTTPEHSAQYTRLTYLPILLKTLSKAMLEWPLFRSSITASWLPSSGEKPTMTLRPHADINIALSTPTGLYTPTIQRVDTYSVYSLSSQLKHLAHLGRQVPCALTPAEMPKLGGTLTVSNIGGIGDGEAASPVLVPGGGVAIVAIGRAKWVWDVSKGEGERRLKVGVSWSADHRVVEGAELVAFIETWRSWVEAPQRLIGEGI